MNADDLKKLTMESLNQLAALLEQGHSERLLNLLKTMARSITTAFTTFASSWRNGERPLAWLGFTPGALLADSFARARRASQSSRRF